MQAKKRPSGRTLFFKLTQIIYTMKTNFTLFHIIKRKCYAKIVQVMLR
jgi:hypothetical protein